MTVCRIALGLLALVAGSLPIVAQPGAPGRVAVRFGVLWDGTSAVNDAVVIVQGNRIVSVGSGDGAVPSGTGVVDLRKYVGLPGLIDLHTHITYYWDRAPGTRPRGQRRLPAVTVFLAQDNARKTLETGVTTVRDLNAGNDMDLEMRELIATGAMTGPRILASGPGLSARRGSPPDPDRMRALVEERVKAGVDWIKVFGSRGGFENVDGTQTVSFDEMKAVVDAAHALGKKVAIHSYGASGVRDAVRAGADSVEHGADVDDETLAEMARRGTVWVPTVDHNRYYIDARDDYGFAPGSDVALKDYIARNLDSVRLAVKAGVRIGMGSDAVYTMFGQNTRELEWFVKAGMTPAQALATATTTAAELLGMQTQLGRVAPGFLADLVAVEGDPLLRIDALFTGVRWVMKDGRVVVDRSLAAQRRWRIGPGRAVQRPVHRGDREGDQQERHGGEDARVVRVDAVEQRTEQPRRAEGRQQADDSAGQRQPQPVGHDELSHLGPLRAQGQTDRHFSRSHRRHERHDAVQTHGAQDQRAHPQPSHHRHRHPHGLERECHPIAKGLVFAHGHQRIDCADLTTDLPQHGVGIAGNAHMGS